MNKEVVFVVSSFMGDSTQGLRLGLGGHYRSVRDIAQALPPELNARVIVFGDILSPVLSEDNRHQYVYAKSVLSVFGLSRLRAVIKALVSENAAQLQIVIVGGISTFVSASLASRGLPVSFVWAKPGGPRMRRMWITHGLPMAVFHQKDFSDFQRIDPHRYLALVAGRVSTPARDEAYLARAASPVRDSGLLNVVCVMRFAKGKESPLRLIYKGLRELQGITFTHYGIIRHQEVYEIFARTEFSCPCAAMTDDFSTVNAAKALHAFDAFVGTGRGVIEAMSLGMPAFIPVSDEDGSAVLCAITKANWKVFFTDNFTQRVKYQDLREAGEITHLEQLIANPSLKDVLSSDVRSLYREHLSPEVSRDAWVNIINSTSYKGDVLYDLVRFAIVGIGEIKRILRKTFSGFVK